MNGSGIQKYTGNFCMKQMFQASLILCFLLLYLVFFPSLPPHVHSECSVSGCSLLDFQAVREGSTEPCLSCQQGTLAGYGRQLLASSLDGCWIGVRSSSLTCLK